MILIEETVEKIYIYFVDRASCNDFLVNAQRDGQFFSMYLFIFLTLYMFRAHRAHHQEGKIVSIQPLLAVTLCHVQVEIHFRPAQDTATDTE